MPSGVGGELVFPVHFTFWLHKQSANAQRGRKKQSREGGTAVFYASTDIFLCVFFEASSELQTYFPFPQPYLLALIFGSSLIFLKLFFCQANTYFLISK